MRNLANFNQNRFESLKIGTLIGSFIQRSRKSTSLKFTEELCAMTMKNEAKIEGELTCLFETDVRNLMNFDLNTRKS